MTNRPDRKTGMSRRDFVLGRILGAETGEEASPDVERPWRPSVMRYPQSLSDVAAADSEPDSQTPDKPAKATPAAARRRTIPVLRPPGAIDEESFLRGCTRCELCIEACPHDAIVHAPPRLREAAGTPMIDPDRQPCLMCADYPCISACEPNVLTSLVAPGMGTARVTEHLCVAYHGTTCTTCSEQCPVDGAITLNDGKPIVNEEACTGCGVCRHVCPAPENAILLMPTFIRPTPQPRQPQEPSPHE